MLARLAGRAAFRSPRFLGAAAPVISVSRAHEQSNNLLRLAGSAALLSVLMSSNEPASCGKRGPQPAAKQKAAAPAPPKPKGKGPVKRTPTSAFDPAAKDDDIYQCERIVAQRLAKGVTQHNVKWAGYGDKDNTWEPIENLAGCEEFIADFKEREKTRIAQLEAVAEAKHREKQEAAAKAASDAAEAAAAARVAAQGEAAASDGPTRSPRKAVADVTAASDEKAKQSKRSSPWWAAFDETGAPAGKACCKLLKLDGKVCGEPISTSTATNLKNHVMYKHPDDFAAFDKHSLFAAFNTD
jgi:hypothetical protein